MTQISPGNCTKPGSLSTESCKLCYREESSSWGATLHPSKKTPYPPQHLIISLHVICAPHTHTHNTASSRPLPSFLCNELFVKARLKHRFFHEVFLDPSRHNICPSLSCLVHSTGFEGRGLLFIASDEELTVSQNTSGSAQSWRQFSKASASNKSLITTGSSPRHCFRRPGSLKLIMLLVARTVPLNNQCL